MIRNSNGRFTQELNLNYCGLRSLAAADGECDGTAADSGGDGEALGLLGEAAAADGVGKHAVGLPRLRRLDLVGNRLTSLGASSPLWHCPELRVLVLTDNELQTIDGRGLARLQRLERLFLRFNRLSALPFPLPPLPLPTPCGSEGKEERCVKNAVFAIRNFFIMMKHDHNVISIGRHRLKTKHIYEALNTSAVSAGRRRSAFACCQRFTRSMCETICPSSRHRRKRKTQSVAGKRLEKKWLGKKRLEMKRPEKKRLEKKTERRFQRSQTELSRKKLLLPLPPHASLDGGGCGTLLCNSSHQLQVQVQLQERQQVPSLRRLLLLLLHRCTEVGRW